MKYLPHVDRAKCGGYAMCEMLAPDSFKVVEEVSQVLEPGGEEVLLAARTCPMGAISVTDEDGELVYERE